MSARKTTFANGEVYHVYNRGTDKRDIFVEEYDQSRFLQSMIEFNTLDPIGSIYAHSFHKSDQLRSQASKLASEENDEEKLVEIIAYCLNQNHYHFILKQVSDRGIEKYMQRIGTGYTKYFNSKYERSGVLFQGKFKAIHIDTNEYLLHASAYVNLNDRVHHFNQLRSLASKSSWGAYVGSGNIANGVPIEKNIVLGQFRNPSEYAGFAENSLRGTLERRGLLTEEHLLEKD